MAIASSGVSYVPIGKIGHEQSPLYSARRRPGVVQHFLERHLGRVFVTEHDHADRIADEDDVDPAFIEQTGGRIIISGQRGDAFARDVYGRENPPSSATLPLQGGTHHRS